MVAAYWGTWLATDVGWWHLVAAGIGLVIAVGGWAWIWRRR